MKSSFLVSIILPTYNSARWIRRSINSVLAQTYPAWELIVWDDGSTDSTTQIVSSYTDKRIKYYHASNKGVSFARNQAILQTRGEYLAFLDSDDEWYPNKLSDQVSIFHAFPQIDVLFSNFQNVNELRKERYYAFDHYKKAMRKLETRGLSNNLFLITSGILEILAVDNFIATDTVILRRGLLEYCGKFNENLRSSEDFELWWRTALYGARFAFTKDVYLIRYKMAGSLSNISISSCESNLLALDICRQQALSKKRMELVPYLDGSYRNAWLNKVRAYGKTRNFYKLLEAFFMSFKYGFRIGAVRLLFESLFNIMLGKRFER